MLKFIKGHMTSIDGIEIFPIISFVLFFTMFLAVLVWVIKLSKAQVSEMENIPLESNNEFNNDNI